MSLATNNEKYAATEQIVEHIRDLLSMKVTIPLGNPNLKNVHTNQFIWIDLPEDFELANMGTIGKAMNSTYNRYSFYEEGRWYIEGLTITNDGDKFTMDLELNPFPSSLIKYRDEKLNFEQQLQDLVNENSSSSNTSSSSSSSSSSGLTSNFKGGEGTLINNLAKKIIGSETNILKKAKLIHTWGTKNIHYSYHENCKYCSAESAYKHRSGIACADTSILISAINRAAGVPCYIVHSPNHYYTVIQYNNKLYCSDPTSKYRKFNYYWKPGVGSVKFKGTSSYNRKCGKKPC